MRNRFIFIALINILFFSYANGNVTAVSVKKLEELRKVGIKIIDIRKQKEIEKTGIIPGAYKLNFYKKDGSINRVLWLKRFVNLVKNRHIKFILISKNGEQAKKGAKILYEEKKYQYPYYLQGGMNQWLKHKKPTLK